jgi:GntR family transcriptional regulator
VNGQRIPAEWTSAHPRKQRAQRLAEQLRQQILAGQFSEGDRLDESQLAATYDASRNTVREALGLLRGDGLIDRKRGAGTTVHIPKYGHGLDRLAGLAEILSGYGTVRNQVLGAERLSSTPAEVAERLDLDPSSDVVRLERLRFVSDEPLSYDVSYLPVDIGEPLLSADLAGNDVFALIETTTGRRLGRAEVTVHAANADSDVAGILEILEGAAIFTIERLTRLPDGRPVDAEVLQVRADRLALQATVYRDHREPSTGGGATA